MIRYQRAFNRLDALLACGGIRCASQWQAKVAPYLRAVLSENEALQKQVEQLEEQLENYAVDTENNV